MPKPPSILVTLAASCLAASTWAQANAKLGEFELVSAEKLQAFVKSVVADRAAMFANCKNLQPLAPALHESDTVARRRFHGLRHETAAVEVRLHAYRRPNRKQRNAMKEAHGHYQTQLQQQLIGWHFDAVPAPSSGEVVIDNTWGTFRRSDAGQETLVTVGMKGATEKFDGKKQWLTSVFLRVRTSYRTDSLAGRLREEAHKQRTGSSLRKKFQTMGVPDAPPGRLLKIADKSPARLKPGKLLRLVYGQGGEARLSVVTEVKDDTGQKRKVTTMWLRPPYNKAAGAERAALVAARSSESPDREGMLSALLTVSPGKARALLDDWVTQAGDQFAGIRQDSTPKNGSHGVAANYLGSGTEAGWQSVNQRDGFWTLSTCLLREPAPGQDFSVTLVRIRVDDWFPDGWVGEQDATGYIIRPLDVAVPMALLRVRREIASSTEPGTRPETRIWLDVIGCGHMDEAGALRPLSGDCLNGYGKVFDPVSFSTYEGYFKDGRFDGPGMLVSLRDGTVHTGRFAIGVKHGPAVIASALRPLTPGSAAGDLAIVRRVHYEHGKEVEAIVVQSGSSKTERHEVLDGHAFGPWIAQRGEVLSGDPAQGLCRVRFANLGLVSASFVDGIAEGEALLRTPTGDLKLYECVGGIPALVRYIVSQSDDRARRYGRRPAEIPIGDCLKGDSRKGTATLALGGGQTYTGSVKNGRPHGSGRVTTATGVRFEGNFDQGVRHGKFLVSYYDGAVLGHFVHYDRGRETGTSAVANGTPPKPQSRYVQLRDTVMCCSSCRGLGTVFSTVHAVDEVRLTPFMPGSRHYGSWLWRGYAQRTGQQVKRGGDVVRCGTCSGAGSIRTPGGRVPRSWLKSRR